MNPRRSSVPIALFVTALSVLLAACDADQQAPGDEVPAEEQTPSGEAGGFQGTETQSALSSISVRSAVREVSGDMRIIGVSRLAGRPTTRAVRRDSLLAAGSGRSVLFFDLDRSVALGAQEFPSPLRDVAAAAGWFVAATDSAVVAFTPEEGTLWSVELPALPSTPLAVTRSAVYLGLADGTVFAVDAARGTERFRSRGDSSPISQFVLASGSLFAADAAGTLMRLDATTGEQLWSNRLPAAPVGGISVAAGQLAVATSGAVALLIDAESGDVVLEGNGVSSDSGWAIRSAGQFLIGSDTRVDSVDFVSGETLWSVVPPSALFLDPFVLGDTLFLPGSGALHSYSPSGRRLSSVSLPAPAVAEPQLYEQTLLLALSNGEIMQIGVDGTDAELPLLGAGRDWQLPQGGVFRLRDREVALLLQSSGGGVFDITVTSVPAQDLLLSVVREDGRQVATNMGKVELDQTVRAALEPGARYRLEIVRSVQGQEIEVTVSTARVE